MSRKGSSRPVRDDAPAWVPMLGREVEKKAIEMAREGLQPAVIGIRLRDQYGIPSVHESTGKKLGQIIAEAGITTKVPVDLQNLIRRAVRLQEHVARNRKDLHNIRGLEMMEARIRGLAKYHMARGSLPQGWKYTREGARLLVD